MDSARQTGLEIKLKGVLIVDVSCCTDGEICVDDQQYYSKLKTTDGFNSSNRSRNQLKGVLIVDVLLYRRMRTESECTEIQNAE